MKSLSWQAWQVMTSQCDTDRWKWLSDGATVPATIHHNSKVTSRSRQGQHITRLQDKLDSPIIVFFSFFFFLSASRYTFTVMTSMSGRCVNSNHSPQNTVPVFCSLLTTLRLVRAWTLESNSKSQKYVFLALMFFASWIQTVNVLSTRRDRSWCGWTACRILQQKNTLKRMYVHVALN